MWSSHEMIDFAMTDWLDADLCTSWLERHLHPEGLHGPHGGRSDRRRCRAPRHVPADRGRVGAGSSSLLTGTVCAKTRQPPAPRVRWRRGIAKGAPTARLARELRRACPPLQTLRPRLHAHRHATAPTDGRPGTACDADARDPHAGENKPAPSCSP
jgi:hypothetical protein